MAVTDSHGNGLFFFLFRDTGQQTQGPACANKQALYHIPRPFHFILKHLNKLVRTESTSKPPE